MQQLSLYLLYRNLNLKTARLSLLIINNSNLIITIAIKLDRLLKVQAQQTNNQSKEDSTID